MKNIKTGSVLFNKETKTFDDGNGNSVDEMIEGFVYVDCDTAFNELHDKYDIPEDFEIWDIKITYETI